MLAFLTFPILEAEEKREREKEEGPKHWKEIPLPPIAPQKSFTSVISRNTSSRKPSWVPSTFI